VSELFCLVERYFGLDRDAFLWGRSTPARAARAAAALRLRSIEGFSRAEIARVLHRHPTTVDHLLGYAVRYYRTGPTRAAFIGVSEAP
jgi:hypothetical protein